MNKGKCWSCERYWEWILSNGLCMVCNAYKFTKCDENSPIVDDTFAKEIGVNK